MLACNSHTCVHTFKLLSYSHMNISTYRHTRMRSTIATASQAWRPWASIHHTMPPVDVPNVIHISKMSCRHTCRLSTFSCRHNAVIGNCQWVYIWDPNARIFMCDQISSDGFPDEKLVIDIEVSDRGTWFVAVEGSLSTGGFAGRRPAFRSQERFWTVGWHDWQVNRNKDVGQPVWDSSRLSAETEVPAGSATVQVDISY
jgi:hypothetical protein